MKNNKILITHGNGGRQTRELIENLFLKFFNNLYFQPSDSVILNLNQNQIVVTTDNHIVKPIFFKGGNIGKLSITGTINDLAVSGAKPLFITIGFIIEEGFSLSDLEKILYSMQEELSQNQVSFIAGDTKVVPKGEMDGIFINTTGIGIPMENPPLGLDSVQEGDRIIISGTIGDHGASIYVERNQLDFDISFESDCGSILKPVEALLKECKTVKILRDPTRGGLATVLNEFVENQSWGIEIFEEQIPIKEEVKGICDLLGIEVFHLASEGRFVCIISEEETQKAMRILKRFEISFSSSVIGKISKNYPSKVILHTKIGGKRILDLLSSEILPRIC